MSEEKLFNERLDRLLAGEEIRPDERLSDDLLADLELARIILAGRDEPSQNFRIQLKYKLLRKLALQNTEALPVRKPGVSRWLEEMFSRRLVWGSLATAALVITLIVVSTVLYSSRNQNVSAPAAMKALPEASYSANLPARMAPSNLTFSLQTQLSSSAVQAIVYQVKSPNVNLAYANELAGRLGMTGTAVYSDDKSRIIVAEKAGPDARHLTVWTASGAIEWSYVSPEKLYPAAAINLPSTAVAKRTAYDLLRQADLLPAGYDSYSKIENAINVTAGGSYPVVNQGSGQTTQKPPGYWIVDFPYLIDGVPATGPGGKIEVLIGDDAQVLSLFWGWRDFTPAYSGNVRPQDSAYSDLTGGGGSLDVPLESRQLVVKQVQLKYWIEPPSERQSYAVPVYEFKGDCLDNNGRTLESFTAWTKAVY
ncbi:MAG: hypothetical protein ACYDHZ_04075 [Dehalococcoidia bacterium]|jgi:hypothetical protein